MQKSSPTLKIYCNWSIKVCEWFMFGFCLESNDLYVGSNYA